MHLTTLQEGYKNQLAQLKQGLEQMLMQKEQIDTNIPLLETEIEAVSISLEKLGVYLGTDEEEWTWMK
mgnify:FL=1